MSEYNLIIKNPGGLKSIENNIFFVEPELVLAETTEEEKKEKTQDETKTPEKKEKGISQFKLYEYFISVSFGGRIFKITDDINDMRQSTDLGTLLNIGINFKSFGIQFEISYTILKSTRDEEDNNDGNSSDVDIFTMGFNVYYVFDFNFSVNPLVRIGYGTFYLNYFRDSDFEGDAPYYYLRLVMRVKSGDAFIELGINFVKIDMETGDGSEELNMRQYYINYNFKF